MMMKYEAKNFDQLMGTSGFSDQLLNNHFTLYKGYVANTNKLMESLNKMVVDNRMDTPEFAELNRRFGWEFNGMRLHELYFGNLAKGGSRMVQGSPLFNKLTESFGSYEKWEKEFKATGAMRGIGWVILYYDTIGDCLFNAWINEHDAGHLAGAVPLLVMDVFEHAFITDYGLKRADYIDAFFKAIDWKVVSTRFDQIATKKLTAKTSN